METREAYLERIGAAQPSKVLGRRIFIGATSCIDTLEVEEPEHLHVAAETHVAVLVRDLGTLTPYRELGRGRP